MDVCFIYYKYNSMLSTEHFHPMLVHFPIALVMIGFLADLASLLIKKEICLPKISFYLLILGTLGAFAAVLSGLIFTNEMSGAAGEVRETHELLAFATVSVLTVTSILRIILLRKPDNKGLKLLAFILYAVAAVCVSLTGALGGTLVYNYMMPL